MQPIVIINAVGLTPRLLKHAPRLQKLADAGWSAPLREVLPAVTCTAQATILTGKLPSEHGIVANGWHFRDTQEVRFWQQSNKLIEAEPFYATARRVAQQRGLPFKSAKLFWWYNQGAEVDISITPKPWYGVDGNKVFGITGTPLGLSESLVTKLGSFPFSSFWGPMAGRPATSWIARCAAEVLTQEEPTLSLVYLPHLDYEPQRHGPSGCDMAKLVRELDDDCEPLLEAAKKLGARVWVLSEYGHCDVKQPVYLNRVLRQAGLIGVRNGPFGEQWDPYNSRAFAVCDHQLAHVSVANPSDIPRVKELLVGLPGVDKLYEGAEREAIGLQHSRSGELVLLSKPDAWFAYPFWLNDDEAPDYARAVAIHHKPGYDPCELFFDPALKIPKLYAAWKVLRKKLGFRMTMDVVPLDARIVHGSHGLIAADADDAAILVADGPKPSGERIPMTAIRDLVLQALGLV
jgi:predicted AlkP superfamily pyrophosphatase or phosphodiesterase